MSPIQECDYLLQGCFQDSNNHLGHPLISDNAEQLDFHQSGHILAADHLRGSLHLNSRVRNRQFRERFPFAYQIIQTPQRACQTLGDNCSFPTTPKMRVSWDDEHYYLPSTEYEPFGWKERHEKKGEKPFLSLGPPKIGYFWSFRGDRKEGISVDLNVGEQCRSTAPAKNSDSDAVYKLLFLQTSSP